jgi:Fungal specific transcription factor domain
VNGQGDTELDEKWKSWAVQESYKRLAFHSFIHDAQTTMTAMVNPVISYAELTLSLPCPKEVWMAKTAKEWKAAYLNWINKAQSSENAPSFQDVLRDLSCLAANQNRVDLQFSALIYLHGYLGNDLGISSTRSCTSPVIIRQEHSRGRKSPALLKTARAAGSAAELSARFDRLE